MIGANKVGQRAPCSTPCAGGPGFPPHPELREAFLGNSCSPPADAGYSGLVLVARAVSPGDQGHGVACVADRHFPFIARPAQIPW